ncbi:MAG: ATP-binding protein [Betaproteobacteria bacterium]|nr:MAG: ATP-binding protein [Betaproteobacteria bacterium]
MPKAKTKTSKPRNSGRLRIGDDWNAITIIALSQSNPLKAVAEFVENSIDAGARQINIIRGRERGEHYLMVSDDGQGIPRDDNGIPDFRYVGTHICDSVKRRLKANGAEGIQGEFGIGLLSFWTVGQELTMTCAGADGKTYQMHMAKGDPSYSVSARHRLFPDRGTELKIKPLLPGIRQFSGEKIQWYLASELRDRIRHSGVRIKVVDRHTRKSYEVQPREFGGRLIHALPVPRSALGEIYLELYLDEPKQQDGVGLYRSGTRVLEHLSELEEFQRPPWNEGCLQGIVDVPFLNLTPGTRTGVVRDHAYSEFCTAMEPIAQKVNALVEEQRKAEEERASRQTLRTIQKAFREALLTLPPEEYDWFDIREHGVDGRFRLKPGVPGIETAGARADNEASIRSDKRQKAFFEYAGPLFSVRIAPSSCVLPIGQTRTLRAIARDRSRHQVEHDLTFAWDVVEGDGALENSHDEIVKFTAPAEPGLTRVRVIATQGEITCEAEALITVTDSLLPETRETSDTKQGLPGYTFKRAPGELWRSRFDAEQNVIVINNGHRDFVFAARTRALKLRYIARLFAKELVCKNFPGYSPGDLLERMIELLLYTEENLK